MFKKLRNNLLIVNSLIIAALVIGSFSAIFLMTARNAGRGVEEKLERSLDFRRDRVKEDGNIRRFDRGDILKNDLNRPSGDNALPPDGEAPTDGDVPPEENQPEEKQPFSLTFTVTADAEGNIQSTNIPFELDEDFYSEKTADIIFGEEDNGYLKSESGYWAYRKKPSDGGYVIAFTDIRSERDMLRNLLVILLLVAAASLTAAFLISLYSANRAIKPIEESYNKQKRFVADASHELKTPLTTINTNIDVLLSHGDSKINDEKKWLVYIKSEAQRMTKLTNDLLYLARADHDGGETLFDRVSFSEAAENVILTMEAVAFEKNISLSYDIEPDIYVRASQEKLKQLVMIFLDNALKYTPENGDITVGLKTHQKRKTALLSVRNSGSGIAPEELEHIFERFYRADKSRARSSGGFGLGLAIARAIAEEAGGSVSARSEQGKYAEFIAEIPMDISPRD